MLKIWAGLSPRVPFILSNQLNRLGNEIYMKEEFHKLRHKRPSLSAQTPVYVSLAIGLCLPGPSLLQLSHNSTPLPCSSSPRSKMSQPF